MMENRSCNGHLNISRLRATDSPQKFLNDECFGSIVYIGYFVYITNTGEIRRYGCGCQFSAVEIGNEKAKEAEVKGSEGEVKGK